MMAQIKVYSKKGARLGSTSKAFDTVVREELMREFTLNFSVRNSDSIFRYIEPDTVYECEGERFDITDIGIDTAGVNVTTVSAEHVAYRLNEYTVPANYAFVGTAKEIGADILKVSGANVEFTMGECSDYETQSFSLNNDKETTARAAILALTSIGVEVCFNNFIINLPERLGAAKETPLVLSRRRWQKDNGWTYEVDIADTGDISVGDTFPIVSDGVKKGTTKRIIGYERHLEDPAQNSVTLGVFVRDDASNSVAVENKLENSVQQGEKYSNVSIDHSNGFKATNLSETQRVLMNGDDCFVVQVKQNDEWVTVNSLEIFGLLIDRLTSMEAKEDFYIKVGKIDDKYYGLRFYSKENAVFNIGMTKDGFISLDTESDVRIRARRKTNTDNSLLEFDSRNISFQTENIVVKLEDGTSQSAFTGTVEVTQAGAASHIFEIAKGLIVNVK